MILSDLFLFLFYVEDYYYDFIWLDGVTERRGGEREGRGVMEDWGGRRVTAGSGSRRVGGRLKECRWKRGRKKRKERKENRGKGVREVMNSSFLLWSHFFLLQPTQEAPLLFHFLYLLFHLLSSFFLLFQLFLYVFALFPPIVQPSKTLSSRVSCLPLFLHLPFVSSFLSVLFALSLILYLTVRFLAFLDFLYPYQIPLLFFLPSFSS